MKNFYRIVITLLLVISLALSATSCDTLAELGIITDNYTDDNTDNDGNATGSDGDNTTADTEKDNVSDGEEDNEENTDDAGNNEENGNGNSGSEDNNDNDNNGENGGEDDDTEKVPVINTDFEGGIVYLPNEEDPVLTDPYLYVDKEEFYANYTPAVSYRDAYYRSRHGLLSGTLGDQDPVPTVSDYQPILDGMLVKNSAFLFSEDGNTYYIVDAYGNIVNKIYKGGAYIMLEEVAAYVFAFGTYPANHSTSKNTSPSSSPFGKFLRVNHSNFSGNTSRYPYEPELPNISGCGGDLDYYEMDIGTTGTDTGNGYAVAPYNNGTKIVRGAARIVYAKEDLDRDGVIEIGEVYVFYTYNHYNDFQEYLGYEGGWGVMFGNVTGGGTLSSKYDYNPTPYVEVAYTSLVNSDGTPAVEMVVVVVACLPQREEI